MNHESNNVTFITLVSRNTFLFGFASKIKKKEQGPCSRFFFLLVNDLGLESLEGGDWDVGDIGVQLLLGILVIVTLTGQADANAVLDGLDTLGPDLLVQGRVQADIRGTHRLLGKVLDGLDGVGSTLLEGPDIIQKERILER